MLWPKCLLSIAVPRYLQATVSAREKARNQNMATIRDALDKYNADQGSYPSMLADLVTRQYLRSVPVDPVSGSNDRTLLTDPVKAAPGIYDIAPPAAGAGTSRIPLLSPSMEMENTQQLAGVVAPLSPVPL